MVGAEARMRKATLTFPQYPQGFPPKSVWAVPSVARLTLRPLSKEGNVYDSSDVYDFKSQLPATTRRTYWDTVEHVDVRGRRSPLAASSCKQLLKHAQKFGPEMVNETAQMFGVKMTALAVEQPKRVRHTGPGLKAQVLELHSRVPSLPLSPTR
jgi:hypothetical protein